MDIVSQDDDSQQCTQPVSVRAISDEVVGDMDNTDVIIPLQQFDDWLLALDLMHNNMWHKRYIATSAAITNLRLSMQARGGTTKIE